jgi:Domain of unknown function (DUF4265)
VTQRSELDEGLVKVFFDVPEKDGSVMKTESLWAEPVGGDRYRLRNVPFLVFGFSEQDVIIATENEGTLRVTGVAVRGGHSTYRLVLPENTNEENFLQDWIPLKKLGCTYERATRRYVAIDVPPPADIYAVYKALEEGESAGLWEFEEGHCGHLPPKTRPH